jgi:hypothetical protein
LPAADAYKRAFTMPAHTDSWWPPSF